MLHWKRCRTASKSKVTIDDLWRYAAINWVANFMQPYQEMLAKAKLAMKIGEIIKTKKLSPANAAAIFEISHPELSGLLRGQFSAISETKMIECLNGDHTMPLSRNNGKMATKLI
jgi:predicted XRE-type DNA-binding protein